MLKKQHASLTFFCFLFFYIKSNLILIFYHKCRYSSISWTEVNQSFRLMRPLPLSSSLLNSTLLAAELFIKETISQTSNHSKTTQTSILLPIWTEVRKRRKKKSIPLRRKINTFTKELKWEYTPSTALMVLINLFRKGKRNPTKKDLPFMWTRNLYGTTLGQILLWILPHNH